MLSSIALSPEDRLPEEHLERVLARLGFNARPEPTFATLGAIYDAWCQRVPFDNVRKLIHLRDANPEPLPGSTPEDFFAAWLKYGTGGTCWSGAGALHRLLTSLGFSASRGVATMLVAPDLPPNHGTVMVQFGSTRYLVDCSILHGAPLPLEDEEETIIPHAAWGVRCSQRDGRWHIQWRPLHRVEGFECRLESFGASSGDFRRFYEQTRGWSPFNYQVTARLNRPEHVVGTAFGHSVQLHADGRVSRTPVSAEESRRLLIEEIGISEELIRRLPADLPTPPPPGSRTALKLSTLSAAASDGTAAV